MPKISPLKLLDEALLPITLVVAAKLGGVFLTSYLFQIPWQLSFNPESVYQIYFINFQSARDVILVSNFSDLLALAVCGIGVTWIIFRSHFLNLDTVHPKLSAHLHRSGKEFLLSDSYHLYHQTAVWLTLSWVVFSLTLANTLLGLTSNLILGVALTTSVGLSLILYSLIRAGSSVKNINNNKSA